MTWATCSYPRTHAFPHFAHLQRVSHLRRTRHIWNAARACCHFVTQVQSARWLGVARGSRHGVPCGLATVHIRRYSSLFRRSCMCAALIALNNSVQQVTLIKLNQQEFDWCGGHRLRTARPRASARLAMGGRAWPCVKAR